MKNKVVNFFTRVMVSALVLSFVCSGIAETGIGALVVQAEESTGMEKGKLALSNTNSGVIKKDGSLWMWGMDRYLGSTEAYNGENRCEPGMVMEDVECVSAGTSHWAAVKKDGSLWIWGEGYEGKLGFESPYGEVDAVQIMDDVRSVSLGGEHSAVIKQDGSLWIWGDNTYGQIGNGTIEDQVSPIKIMDNVVSTVLGYNNSAAIKQDGSLWMWGDNDHGQIGNGTIENQVQPVKVMEDVASVSLGYVHSAMIKQDGSLWMTGNNIYGEFGNGNANSVAYTQPVKIMEDVHRVAVGDYFSLILKKDGSLWSCGNNAYGQIGNGSLEDQLQPIKIMDDVADIAVSFRHSAAIKKDGSLWMWGDNTYGMLGNGTTDNSYIPIQIMSAGSIDISDIENDNEPEEPDEEEDKPIEKLPITVEPAAKPKVKVVDVNGKPIVGAEVKHNGVTYPTNADGIVTLGNYKKGTSLEISKDEYETKTISSYVRDKSGCSNITLGAIGKILHSVIMEIDGTKINVMETDATINIVYKTTKFALRCEGTASASYYELYSGDKIIAQSKDGYFRELSYGSFNKKQDVVVKAISGLGKVLEQHKLLITVIDLEPDMFKFSLGGETTIQIPKNIPLFGGMKMEIDLLDKVPVTLEVSGDGNVQVGINAEKLVKKDRDWFDTLKKLNKKNFRTYMGALEKGSKKPQKDKFAPTLNVIGYLEGNWEKSDYLKGKIIIELSASDYLEKQYIWFGVPTVVEISVSGKVNYDGSISFAIEEGFSGDVNINGEVKAGLYAGVGLANYFSAGVYGKTGIGIRYDLFPIMIQGVNEFYVIGDVGVKCKILGRDLGRISLVNGKYYIIRNEVSRGTFLAKEATAPELLKISIDNHAIYNTLERDYLAANGGEEMQWTAYASSCMDGNMREIILQDAAYLDIVPQVVKTENSAVLFYMTDGGADRSSADRSQLVYSIYQENSGSWSEPIAVCDDTTADFSSDIYADGDKVYVVWQNAKGSLEGDLTLDEIASSLNLQVSVYDETTGEMTDFGTIERESSLQPQRPQIAVEEGKIHVYWYENSTDNVFGFTGINKMYMATIKEGETEAQIVEQQSEESDASFVEGDNVDLREEDMSEFEGIPKEDSEEEDLEDMEMEDTVSDNGIEELMQESVSENGIEENIAVASVSGNSFDDLLDIVEQDKNTSEVEIEEVENELLAETPQDVNLMGSQLLQEAKWMVTLIGEESQCISSADAGIVDEILYYAYTAGELNDSYEVIEGRVVRYTKENGFKVMETGKPEHVEISEVFSEPTLTWYQDGNIHYINEDKDIDALFDGDRLTSSFYTLIADGKGNPEIIFPLNVEGKSNLYRIAYKDGEFLNTLAITDQDDYIQYVDGFIHGNETVFVYNQMKVDENLEEVENSLCTGILPHSYYDVNLVSAGSLIKMDSDTQEDYLEIAAQVYNNGTMEAEGLNLQLGKSDGTILETVAVEDVFEPGEYGYVEAAFSLDNITEEDDYTLAIVGKTRNNTANNSFSIKLGEALLQMTTDVVNIGETRTLQIGIENKGVTACGGSIRVCDVETGIEYCSSIFEPINQDEITYVEVPIVKAIFKDREYLVLEIQIVSENEGEILSEQVVVYAPTYTITFNYKDGIETVGASYGENISFPQNPVEDGKRFKGWYTSDNPQEGTLYTEETPITESVTLYACFAEENENISLEECSVLAIPNQLYTGKALKPAVIVKWGSTILNPKTDYSVSYTDNKEQGTATVTITGKGKYAGSITRQFAIYYPMSKVGVKAIPKVKFDGSYHTPKLTVTYLKKALEEGTDYILTYSNNRNAGTAAVTITGKGKYSGSKTVNFTIEGISIASMKFEKMENAIYSGDEEKSTVIVRNKDDKPLRNGADYKVVYENTINKGTASVTVIGNGNYIGTKKMTYKILAKTITADMVEEIVPLTYTGESLKPEVTVRDGEKTLIFGKDYKVSYSGNKKAGTGYVTVTGVGNYTGKVKIPFTIQNVNLEDNPEVRIVVSDMAYTGRACKPSVQVYYKDKKLSGSDYMVSYMNNTYKGQGHVAVTGKGNYAGTISEDFRIVEKKQLISSLKIDKLGSYAYTGEAIEPNVKVMDGDYTLIRDVDYEVVYDKQYHTGTASVTISGKGNYAGSKILTYKITKRSLGQKNVWAEGFDIMAPESQLYTGNALKPDILLKDKGRLLELGKDYTLSYSANTNPGTAKITVKGKGNYQGSIGNVIFTIEEWNYDSLQVQAADQIYTGKALKPQVIFTLDGEEIALKIGKTVKLTYSNNKDAGTAKVTIVGVGIMKDMVPLNISFEIVPADLEDAVVTRIANQTFKGVALKPVPKVNVGKNSLKAGRDFEVSYIRNKIKGEAEIIIKGKGNYCGKCSKSFIIQ